MKKYLTRALLFADEVLTKMKGTFTVIIIMLICSLSHGQKPRARDLGVPFIGTTGQFNAITDVKEELGKIC